LTQDSKAATFQTLVIPHRRLEGLVSKRRDRPYRAGRSPDWIKVKHPAMERVKDLFSGAYERALTKLRPIANHRDGYTRRENGHSANGRPHCANIPSSSH
jgi:hypothetical protein